MRHPDERMSREEEELTFARVAAFFITVAVVAVLALVGSAHAFAPEEEELGEEADVCWEAESSAEEEAEEEGEWPDCEEEAEAPASTECVLASASATVTAAAKAGKVRLAIRYRSHNPALVSVGYKLRGAKGALSLGRHHERFGRGGVFRTTAVLDERQMEKVLAAREFTIELHAVNSPRHCRDLLERHLTARRAVPGGLLWADPSARQSRV